MSNVQGFISFDGLAANVQVANALIEGYYIELSAVKAQISCIEEEKREETRTLRSNKKVMREELQRQINDLSKQEISEVKQLEATFDSRKAPFESESRAILAKIDAVKGAIAPIRKLPAEILGSIFQEVLQYAVSPWLLATVSKSWRITSFTTPSLWSNLCIGKLNYPSRWTVDGEPRYATGNRLLCRTLDELAYFAEKSGAVSLDVMIVSSLTGENDAVMRGLLEEPYCSRICSISFPSTKTTEETAGWTVGRFPRLRTIQCASLQEPLMELIVSQTDRLESLINLVGLSSALSSYPFWGSLRVLRLGHRTQVADFNRVVSGLSLIEDISGVPSLWPDVATPRVTLKHIKSIKLSCIPQYLARLHLPRLENLVWYGHATAETHAEDLDGGPNCTPSFPNVLIFQARASGETFEWVLKHLPNVQTISLEPHSIGISQGAWALDLLKSLASTEDMLCPQVRCLSMGSCCCRVGTSKTLANPLIRRFIKSRVALGIPLEHFAIWWTSRSGKPAQCIQYI